MVRQMLGIEGLISLVSQCPRIIHQTVVVARLGIPVMVRQDISLAVKVILHRSRKPIVMHNWLRKVRRHIVVVVTLCLALVGKAEGDSNGFHDC